MLPLYERLPLTYREQKKLDAGQPEPWVRYAFDRVWGTASNGERFAYYVERGEPTVMRFEYLENEFFANDLQKVNVTRADSIVRFCAKYGFPVSSGYDGAQRLARYRRRFMPGSARYRPYASTSEMNVEGGAMAAGVPLRHPSEAHADSSQIGRSPYLLSEEARRIHLNDRSAVGVISEAEAIQTIRALQVSTALLSAVGYAVENPSEWGATDLADYLCDRSHMAQNGVTFFLRSDTDALFENTRLKSYDTLLAESGEFRSLVEVGDKENHDTRAIYTSSLGAELMLAANASNNFLINSLASYSADIDGKAHDAPHRKRADKSPWRPGSIRLNRMMAKAQDEEPAGCLPAAIISQFGLLYDDPAKWRICANCGRIFKKYREEKPGKVIQKTRFCKRSCANAYSKKKSQGLITE